MTETLEPGAKEKDSGLRPPGSVPAQRYAALLKKRANVSCGDEATYDELSEQLDDAWMAMSDLERAECRAALSSPPASRTPEATEVSRQPSKEETK